MTASGPRRLTVRLLPFTCLALFSAPLIAQPTTVTLFATDTDCIDTTGANWNDNRLRAYWSSRYVDGFMKFDLTSLPVGATITAMTLRTYHEYGFNNPLNGPTVRIYRVATDTWSRGPVDPHPGLNEILTPLHSNFPSTDLTPWDWQLDVNAANWQVDLLDGTLSLAMRNELASYSYVYWYGSNVTPAPPELKITYTNCAGMGYFQVYGTGCAGSGSVTPALTGTGCPTPGGGTVSLGISNAVPFSTGYLLFGLGQGVAPINFACNVEILPVLPAPVFLLPMGSTGSITLGGAIPASVVVPVDVYLQVFFQDSGAVSGVAVSNPLKLHVQ